MPLTIKNFSRAWQGHFLSQVLQTWQICFFFVDVQMILLSYLDASDCLEIEKNEKAFHSSCSELLVLFNNEMNARQIVEDQMDDLFQSSPTIRPKSIVGSLKYGYDMNQWPYGLHEWNLTDCYGQTLGKLTSVGL